MYFRLLVDYGHYRDNIVYRDNLKIQLRLIKIYTLSHSPIIYPKLMQIISTGFLYVPYKGLSTYMVRMC